MTTESITVNSDSNHTPKCREIWKLALVLRKTGLSRSTLYSMLRENEFPRQRKISKKSVGWFSDQVQDFIDSRPVA